MERYAKSRQNFCQIFVKEIIFNAVRGLHLESLIKDITHLSQVFYDEIVWILRVHLSEGQLLNGYFLRNSVQGLDKRLIQRNIYIHD